MKTSKRLEISRRIEQETQPRQHRRLRGLMRLWMFFDFTAVTVLALLPQAMPYPPAPRIGTS